MYHIDVKKDKPDKNRLKANVEEMMLKGIKIGDIEKLSKQFNGTRDSLKQEFNSKYGVENPNSTVQIAAYLEHLSSRVPLGSRNDIIDCCYIDGKWVTDKYVMNKLSLLGYEVADDLLEYRAAKKNADALNQLVKYMDENRLIHPCVSLAKTNRINYSNPGLLTTPKYLLRYVIEPRVEGDTLYSVDIKNQEPAILINALGDKELVDALKSEEGLYNNLYKFVFRPYVEMNLLFDTFMEDRVYTQEEIRRLRTVSPAMYLPTKAPCMSWYYNGKRVVAVQRICQGTSVGSEDDIELPERAIVELEDGTTEYVNVQWEEIPKNKRSDYTLTGYMDDIEIRMSPQERKEFKTSFLAITYGASSLGIDKQCRIIDGKTVYSKITKLKKMAEYRNKCGTIARQRVQALCTLFGTPVYAEKYGSTQELKRSLLSIPIQGTGADILDLLVMRGITEAKKKFGDVAPFIYYTRHDELIIEVPKAVQEQYGEGAIKEWLIDTFEHQLGDWTPFMVEVERIEQGDMKDLLFNTDEF